MNNLYPPKLQNFSNARIIAPSRSLKIISHETRFIANDNLENLGINVSYSKNADKCDSFFSSSVEDRVYDIEKAFEDKDVKLILTTIGGFNSIQIIEALNYNLIKQNPKIICGYSDVTVLLNAIHCKTGLVTYYGPHYSSFGMKLGNGFTIEAFKKVVFNSSPMKVDISKEWSEDSWFLDQENRIFYPNRGPLIIQRGYGEGFMIGGNIQAFQLTNGTSYQASIDSKILFLENDGLDKDYTDREFDRRLESILLQKNVNKVAGVVIGRFKSVSNMTIEKLKNIINSKKKLKGVPVVYGFDFGHTMPMLTIPIGGYAKLDATGDFPIWNWTEY